MSREGRREKEGRGEDIRTDGREDRNRGRGERKNGRETSV